MFKLYSIYIDKHHYLKGMSLNFVVDREKQNQGPYTTLLIGPNGTGKSQILGAIIEVFNYLAVAKVTSSTKVPVKFQFEIKYGIGNREYHIIHKSRFPEVLINGNHAELNQIELPEKFLASAISINDRFPFLKETSKFYNDRYQYLGLRATANSAYISFHVKKIIDNLSSSAKKLTTLPNIRILFDKLNLELKLTISYRPGRRFSLKESNTFFIMRMVDSVDNFITAFRDFISEFRKQSLDERRLFKYEKLLADRQLIKRAIDYLGKRVDTFHQRYLNQINITYEVDFNVHTSLTDFEKDADILKLLRELEVLSVNDVNIQKKKPAYRNSTGKDVLYEEWEDGFQPFDFEYASSGEYHLLTSFLGIISTIEDNSLIVIDEPEISLHPNWQMQYMDILNQVFENYKGTHFIIASHSHFLVSDLKGVQSAILALKIDRDKGKIIADLKDLNTYSWSAEQVLLEIFELPTTRNYYVADLVGEILQLMANPDTPNEEIRSKIKRLKELNLEGLSENDPLKEVVDKLIAKLNQNETRPPERKN